MRRSGFDPLWYTKRINDLRQGGYPAFSFVTDSSLGPPFYIGLDQVFNCPALRLVGRAGRSAETFEGLTKQKTAAKSESILASKLTCVSSDFVVALFAVTTSTSLRQPCEAWTEGRFDPRRRSCRIGCLRCRTMSLQQQRRSWAFGK